MGTPDGAPGGAAAEDDGSAGGDGASSTPVGALFGQKITTPPLPISKITASVMAMLRHAASLSGVLGGGVCGGTSPEYSRLGDTPTRADTAPEVWPSSVIGRHSRSGTSRTA